MSDREVDEILRKREARQLRRLERVIDVVYAILIWRAFEILPGPSAEELSWDHIGAFVSTNARLLHALSHSVKCFKRYVVVSIMANRGAARL